MKANAESRLVEIGKAHMALYEGLGETSHGTVACKLHPWLAQYRDDLIPIAAEE